MWDRGSGTNFSAIRRQRAARRYGKYYDHFGESIVNLFDQYGSYGLSDSITNPTNVLTPDTSPRYTGAHNIPDLTGTPEQVVTIRRCRPPTR